MLKILQNKDIFVKSILKVDKTKLPLCFLISYLFVKFVYYDLCTFVFKNLPRLFDKYAVACTEHDALVKSTTKIFSNFVAFSENPNFKTS